MAKVARRLVLTFASFVIAWLAVSFALQWLLGAGNIFNWVFAAVVAAGIYLYILRRDRRVS